MTLDEIHEGHRDRSVVPGADRGARAAREASSQGRALERLSARRAARPEAQGLLRPAPGEAARGATEDEVRARRHALGVRPVYKRVDTCAAEFATSTAYMYSTYEEECEAAPTDRKKIMVLGGGPNRIGQGIEFDYCCVHAALALREDGYETIMVNCNPETVSTDYDTSDRLYFEPLTLEDVLEIVDKEKPLGVIVQYGGQTPLKLARDLEAQRRADHRHQPGHRSTSPRTASASRSCCTKLGLRQPPNRTARTEAEALALARGDRLPAGGAAELRARRPRDGDRARAARPRALHARGGQGLATTRRCCSTASSTMRSRSTSTASATASASMIGGIMEHIEQAGVHSGDSACSLPPYSLSPRRSQDELRRQTAQMARALNVVGLMNVQFAIQDGRRSSTCSRSTRAPRAPCRSCPRRPACRWRRSRRAAWPARSLDEQGERPARSCRRTSRSRKRCSRSTSSPASTRSSGRRCVHRRGDGRRRDLRRGVAQDAARRGRAAAGQAGRCSSACANADKATAVEVARELCTTWASSWSPRAAPRRRSRQAGIPVQTVNKVKDGRPHIVDMIKNGEIQPDRQHRGRDAHGDRRFALDPHDRAGAAASPTTPRMAGARAACAGMQHLRST